MANTRSEQETGESSSDPIVHTHESSVEAHSPIDGAEEEHVSARSPSEDGEERDINPPLPDEPPPLPDEELPEQEDDGWEARWDANTSSYYFFNRIMLQSQWENPRIPQQLAPGTEKSQGAVSGPPPAAYQGYNPKIHGDYDPNADYAKFHEEEPQETEDAAEAAEGSDPYAQSATFNRFTGAFQSKDRGAEFHNDENKSKRQMSAFFDVDKAANAHDGRSLKEERARRKLSKKEVREFNEKRKAKKEQKRREFLMS